MLTVNSFVKATPSRDDRNSSRNDTRSPVPMPYGIVQDARTAAAGGPTSPSGSTARRGRFAPQPSFVQVGRDVKTAHNNNNSNNNNNDDDYSDASSEGSDSSPVERPRRRFVKPSVTTYESCFSRQATGGGTANGTGHANGGRRFNRRPGAMPRVGLASYSFVNSSSTAALALAAASESADTSTSTAVVPAGVRRAPAVSSLSSVLQELMHGRHRALSSYVDATAGGRNPRTFVVEQSRDGAMFVASATGTRLVADAAIGKPMLLLQPVLERKNATVDDALSHNNERSPTTAGSSMRRSDLDASRQPPPRKHGTITIPTPTTRRSSITRRDSTENERSARRSGSSGSSKAKLLGFSSLKSKLAARRSSLIQRHAHKSGADCPMTLDEIGGGNDDDSNFHDFYTPAVLGNSNSSSSARYTRATGDSETAVPMLDPDLVDARARGDSGWEVPLPVVDKRAIVNRPIPFASSNNSNHSSSDDDDDNLLNRSFLNVRDIEFHPRTDKDAAPVSVPAEVLERECCIEEPEIEDHGDDEDDNHAEQRVVLDRATFDSSSSDCRSTAAMTAAQDALSHRGNSFSATSVTAPTTTATGGRPSVSEFLGGYKGQLSTRRASMGQDGAFASRARSVRHGVRKSAAANAAATALTRKLREARNRIPFEFRDDFAPATKAKSRKKLRVRWDLTPYIKEFEVESEDEEEAAAAAQAQIVKAPWERDSDERESDDEDDDDDQW